MNAIYLLYELIVLESYNHEVSRALSVWATIMWVVYGLGILCGILLVVAASKRSATMLMVWIVVWIVLNAIGIGYLFYILISSPKIITYITTEDIFLGLAGLAKIGLAIWTLLIAIGARQDVKREGNMNSSLQLFILFKQAQHKQVYFNYFAHYPNDQTH